MGIEFLNDEGDFILKNPDDTSYLYFPIAGESGVMGSITPNLNGDSKTGQNSFLLEPVSNEDLHSGNRGRNVWVKINEKEYWSVSGISVENKDEVTLRAGKLWHNIIRTNRLLGIQSEVLSYCLASTEKAEIMKVTFTNIGNNEMSITPTVAIPIYGRSADNLRDHRHVTSLLQRIEVKEDGIVVTPALTFDERGHRENHLSYGIHGRDDNNKKPIGFFPILEEFIGEGGSLTWPKAVISHDVPFTYSNTKLEGYEAMGGMQFAPEVLKPGEKKTYYIVLSYNGEGLKYLHPEEEKKAFCFMKEYWKIQSTVHIQSKDEIYDRWLEWVGIQPSLRRIYGCSFLPHHDYGRGGRGWRDLWQDSLALLLMNPGSVGKQLISYYAGVRIDGSNATIIGQKPGEFIADRNSIIRVWMDHGLWPFITTNLYIQQTGDIQILFAENRYFKDSITHRGEERDELWDGKSNMLKTHSGAIYYGTILEHILVQNLTVFYDVGEHNHMRLRGADWNDALDMAKEHGESVAFTAAYAGNLEQLSNLLEGISTRGKEKIEIAQELIILIDQPESVYESAKGKKKILEIYCNMCSTSITGKKVQIKLTDLAANLRKKGEWIKKNIRSREWVTDGKEHYWFNGYYDNNRNQVEGVIKGQIRMMLTSQVFTVMCGVATSEQTTQIIKAVDDYLYNESVGGYRLNTDFKEVKTDLGRMFGFAYGHKENGAVFSHMAVMYAYALYSKGLAKEGYKVLHTLYKHAMNFKIGKIYPGIPEYFNSKGRGMYHYLTGAASWYMLTVLTGMYGVKGEYGDLVLNPQLLSEQFNEDGMTSIQSDFAGKTLRVTYVNKNHKEVGEYKIEEIKINGKPYSKGYDLIRIKKEDLEDLESNKEHEIQVVLM